MRFGLLQQYETGAYLDDGTTVSVDEVRRIVAEHGRTIRPAIPMRLDPDGTWRPTP